MRNQIPRILKRSIHIENAPSVSLPSNVDIHTTSSSLTSSSTEAISSPPSQQSSKKHQFKALGTPPTLVNIFLEPSLPIYIQKGSLLSIYGTALDNISSSSFLLSPFKRIISGFHRFRYSKIETTAPATALVTTDSSTTSVTTLTLDGTFDWAVLPRKSLLAYSGSSLRITTETLPRVTKTDKWYQLRSNVSTGLYSIWKPGYTLISGRGNVAITGEGSIFKIALDKDEEVLIKRDNILGISVKDDDLSRFITEYKPLTITKPVVPVIETQSEVQPETQPVVTNVGKKQLKEFWEKTKQWTNYITGVIYKYIPRGNNDYVKVLGPRTVLLKSKSPTLDYDFNRNSSTIEVLEDKIQKKITNDNPENYLSYVTVKDGKVEFKSTPDFQKTVQSIETKGKQQ